MKWKGNHWEEVLQTAGVQTLFWDSEVFQILVLVWNILSWFIQKQSYESTNRYWSIMCLKASDNAACCMVAFLWWINTVSLMLLMEKQTKKRRPRFLTKPRASEKQYLSIFHASKSSRIGNPNCSNQIKNITRGCCLICLNGCDFSLRPDAHLTSETLNSLLAFDSLELFVCLFCVCEKKPNQLIHWFKAQQTNFDKLWRHIRPVVVLEIDVRQDEIKNVCQIKVNEPRRLL